MAKLIYLDNAATTPLDESLVKKTHKLISTSYGNPSSIHQIGKLARQSLEKARKNIADSIGADPEEVIFTSGGTESNNLAIKGFAEANPEKKHIICSMIEHPSVIEVCRELEKKGYSVDYISVDKNGIVDLDELKQRINSNTLLVSIMHVNNEIGTIQPIEEIGKICKSRNIPFHTDVVQSFGKLKIDVKKTNISMLSASGHKLNAPKGIGILYINKNLKIKPLFDGGGQEKNLRSGTENTMGAIFLASALGIKRPTNKILKSRNQLIKELLKIKGAILNGDSEKRIPNNINISFYGIEGESLSLMLDKEGICVSTGSACSSHKLQESHVLKAIGVDPLYIHGSIRLSLDSRKPLSAQEIKFIATKFRENVEKLRKISPFKLQ